jgi:integrase
MSTNSATILKLNRETVAHLTLPAGKTDLVYWDDELFGFGRRLLLAVRSKQIRATWVIQYRIPNGTSRRMTFADGSLAPHEARKMAVKLLAEAKSGGDPQGDKAKERAKGSHSFHAVVEEFLKIGEAVGIKTKGKPWRERTAYQYRHLLQKCCAPLNGMEIGDIGHAELNIVIRQVERERGKNGKPGRRSAKLTRDRLSTLFHWAVCEGLIESNPVMQTHKIEYDVERERVLSDDELKRVWHACAPEHFPDGGRFGDVVRLLILTGTRRAEVTGLKWSEVDLDSGVWILPEHRSKNSRKHVIPLSPPAVAILKPLQQERRWNGKQFVSDGCVFTTFGAMNVWDRQKQLFERSGTSDWWLHDLRRTMATGMAGIGIAPHIIECCLNHVSGFKMNIGGFGVEVPASLPKLARTYNLHPYHAEMKQAFDRWAEHVMALVEDREDKVTDLASHRKA